jgi:hypothetical protein
MARGRKGRSPDQIRRDRAEIAQLYLQGKLQSEIGATLGLSRQQIGYELKAVRQEWLQSSIVDFNAKKAEELARIDHLERNYWAAWESSKKERQTSTTEQVTCAAGDRLKAALRKEEQVGDPRFLAGVQWCISKRCEILGLDAPKKIAPTTPDGRQPYQLLVKEMSDDELATIERLAERHRQFVAGPSAGGPN